MIKFFIKNRKERLQEKIMKGLQFDLELDVSKNKRQILYYSS